MELSVSLATRVLLAAVLVSTTGCGTINTVFRPDAVASQNLKESRSYCENVPRIYSGVIYGFCTLNGAPDTTKEHTRDASGSLPIFAAELVASGLLDTLVLPYTVYRQNRDGSIEIFPVSRPGGEHTFFRRDAPTPVALTILGLSGALSHDPSAALYIDGKLIAAAEEERFVRDKHAKNRMPYESAKFCLEQAGIKPSDVDVVAIPFAPISLFGEARWHYAKRYWYAPDRALDAILMGNRRYKRYRNKIVWCLEQLGFDPKKIKIEPVEHHLAHASSAYHCSGFQEKTAILGIDGKGEYATTFFGYGENGKIHKIKEFYDPDSLGGLYGAITEFLGFEMLDGEFKVMGMAPYGDASKYDFSRLASFENGELVINTDYANVIGLRRYKEKGKGFYFSPKLIEWLGPKREGDIADEPYIHYAASMQALFEKLALQMIDHYLGDILKDTGKLAFAGGCALNVKLNQKIIARDDVKELFVQPASGDAGTAVGAAAYVSHARGVPVEKMEHVYLGPSYSNEDVIAACAKHESKPVWRKIENMPKRIARIMVDGNPVAWFQGRMEFGPRALGGRSIIGCPSATGVADRINHQIKFRERWRPFCPSMLDTVAPQMIKVDHPAPFMTFTFEVSEEWKTRVPEVVHEDGTSRAQVLKREYNPRYYDMMKELEVLTGNGVSLNTSLNRRGEAMICSPTDALNMFFGSDLQYLIMEDILVVKDGVDPYDAVV
eukprot:gene799-913_t